MKIALAIFGAGVGYLGLKDLEAVGMLWPFVACPERVRGKNDVFKIDNLAVSYGWYKGYVANNKSASEVLKSVHYLSGLMGTTVNVEHVDRVSDEIADLADELSRKTVSSSKSVDQWRVDGYILKWLENPAGGKSLGREHVKELRESCP